ncbi:MAG: 2-amino-4-hydroxy-6-hydroxymethyldihydropteridine diphosphokinase [Bacteroidota bacterium]|jgi:2-amino-4-hydroxy-6-hydroxymethyldihydropteridine diphosphokinase
MIENKKQMHDVYLSLGSNLGYKQANIELAIQHIENMIGKVVCASSLHETQALGFDSDNSFINAACHVQTTLSPLDVLAKTQAIEVLLGRKTKSVDLNYSDRLMDIDILFYDQLVIELTSLHIPHPRLHERLFVLSPLVEIAPLLKHPVLNKNIETLLQSIISGEYRL